MLFSAVVQAVSAVAVAVFTFFLVHYSRKGWGTAEKAATAARDSADATRAALDHSMRSRVEVFEARLDNLGPDKTPVGVLKLRNHSGNAAMVLEYCLVYRRGDLPATPEYPQSGWRVAHTPLIAGGEPYPLELPFNELLTHERWDRIREGQSGAYIYGVARYEDGTGKIRRIGFCRGYDSKRSYRNGAQVFTVTPVAGYNYVDQEETSSQGLGQPRPNEP
jgi:hypothetical protein